MKKITLLISLCLCMVGCQNIKAPDSEEAMQIEIESQVEDNLEISLHEDFSSEQKNAKIYTLKEESYPIKDEKWIRETAHFLYEGDDYGELEKIEDNGYVTWFVEGENNYLGITNTNLYFYSDKEFAHNADNYYRHAGIDAFFSQEASEYYKEKELDFMSFEDAKKLSDSLIERCGYVYNEQGVQGYALDPDSLNKFASDHSEEMEDLKSFLEDIQLSFRDSWEKDEGFYVFYYPCEIEGFELKANDIYATTWSAVEIGKDGILRAVVNTEFQVVDSKEQTIISASEAIEKILTMYKSTILTQKVRIYDLEMVYGITGYDDVNKEYTSGPVWEFSVEMETENGGKETSRISYDAVSGERL